MKKDLIDYAKYSVFLSEKMEDPNIKSAAHLSRLIYDNDDRGKKQYLRNVIKGTNPSPDLVERTVVAFGLPKDYFKLDAAKEASPSEFEQLKARMVTLEYDLKQSKGEIDEINRKLSLYSTKTMQELIEALRVISGKKNTRE